MNETKHTPEPWEVRGLYICASTDTYIAKMLRGDNLNPPDQETYGNANLIAAAPDMLAALKRCVSQMKKEHANSPKDLGFFGAYIEAERAIAKAEGGAK